MAAALRLDVGDKVKLGDFNGEDKDWDAWSVRFEAYCDLAGMGDALEGAESCTTTIVNDQLGAEALQASRTIYALLISHTQGRALGIVTLCPRRHGLEAWRRLKQEYEGRQGSRIAAMLRGVLNPGERWAALHNSKTEFVDMLTAWER